MRHHRLPARDDRRIRIRKLALIGSLAVMVAGTPAIPTAQQVSDSTTSLVFDHVAVIDVEGGVVLPDRRVTIVGNRIEAIGTDHSVAVPRNARVVEARGKYLIPGLWDMHVHTDAAGNPDLALQSSLAHAMYPLFIAHGVTGVREMAQRFLNGADSFRVWRRKVQAGELVGPRTIGPSADLTHYMSTGGEIQTPEDARRVIDSLHAAGDAFVKYHGQPDDPELYLALVREARRVGLPFVGHAPSSLSTLTASDSGQGSIEHTLPLRCFEDSSNEIKITPEHSGPAAFEEEKCAAWTSQLARGGAWITPTLAVHFFVSNLYRPSTSEFFSTSQQPKSLDSTRASWPDNATTTMDVPLIRAVSLLQKTGVPLLAGSDVSATPSPLPGFLLQQELFMLVEAAKLSPLEALRTATLNPAKFLNATDSLGTVAPKKLADLVLLNASPLENIRNVAAIDAVIANGRYFDRAALDSLRVRAERAWPVSP